MQKKLVKVLKIWKIFKKLLEAISCKSDTKQSKSKEGNYEKFKEIKMTGRNIITMGDKI